EVGVLAEALDRLVDHVGRAVAADGNATPALQQAAERPAEDAVLAEPAGVDAHDELGGDEHHEVPVRGVVRTDHHELVQGRQLAFDAPAHEFQHAASQGFGEPVGGQEITGHPTTSAYSCQWP